MHRGDGCVLLFMVRQRWTRAAQYDFGIVGACLVATDFVSRFIVDCSFFSQ